MSVNFEAEIFHQIRLPNSIVEGFAYFCQLDQLMSTKILENVEQNRFGKMS